MSNYKLRPHHGLCLQFFRGKGYSEAFVQNMEGICAAMRKNPMIELVQGADQLCVACPHRIGVADCETQEKVMRYDAKVLALCGINIGDVMPWDVFSAHIVADILQKGLFETVCEDCEWRSICASLVETPSEK